MNKMASIKHVLIYSFLGLNLLSWIYTWILSKTTKVFSHYDNDHKRTICILPLDVDANYSIGNLTSIGKLTLKLLLNTFIV